MIYIMFLMCYSVRHTSTFLSLHAKYETLLSAERFAQVRYSTKHTFPNSRLHKVNTLKQSEQHNGPNDRTRAIETE